MKSLRIARQPILLVALVVLVSAAAPAFAQPTPADAEAFQARIDAAAVALGSHPRYKNSSLKYRQAIAEFVAGNMLFVVLHEMAHAAISELGLPVLGREEDAADSYAATRLIRIKSGVSNRVLTEAAKGWFMADRRDRREGHSLPFYDEHGLNQVRACEIVCLMVGSDKDEFKDLAKETKLPEERQDSCAKDYSRAANSWSQALKDHLRAPDQAETKIEVVYGEAPMTLGRRSIKRSPIPPRLRGGWPSEARSGGAHRPRSDPTRPRCARHPSPKTGRDEEPHAAFGGSVATSAS